MSSLSAATRILIYPAEVESVIDEIDSIAQCAVIGGAAMAISAKASAVFELIGPDLSIRPDPTGVQRCWSVIIRA
jgi:hypothetical protein